MWVGLRWGWDWVVWVRVRGRWMFGWGVGKRMQNLWEDGWQGSRLRNPKRIFRHEDKAAFADNAGLLSLHQAKYLMLKREVVDRCCTWKFIWWIHCSVKEEKVRKSAILHRWLETRATQMTSLINRSADWPSNYHETARTVPQIWWALLIQWISW